MIHELRTYTLQAKKLADFLTLTREVGFKLRTKHSKCLGYWTTEVGELNQVVHLWEYEDYAHRTRTRAALAKDKAWIQKYAS
ncbi:MAG TPA: NIPSNAP family protein, partial [Methylomirabilota bacterium]|nr:NIPSNAP family protein [Methylomirabilota bacterium]